jgi:hypothetical protein
MTKRSDNQRVSRDEISVHSMRLQNASAFPPYRFGKLSASMRGNNAFLIERWLDPTTAIFAKVFGERRGLKNQNIQFRIMGTLRKNFLCCKAKVRLVI